MTRTPERALAVGVIVVLAMLVAGTGSAADTSKDVLVVNDTTQPVPTTAQGTTQVAGTVDIGNTPTVNVGNTPTVNVGNTPTVAPAVPAEPLIQGWSILLDEGETFDRTTVDVPDGKVFVVEAIHGLANLPAGQGLERITIDPALGGNIHLPAFVSGDPAGSFFIVSEQLRLYMEADFDLVTQRQGGTSGLRLVQGTLEGYLVDA